MGSRILTTALLLILVAGTFSCKDWFADLFEDEAYTLTREDYTGQEIRTDGYYYSYNYQDSNIVSITIFYRNGVVIDGIGGQTLLEYERRFSSGEFNNNAKNIKDVWGIFKVVNNEVMIERVVAGGGLRRNAFIDYGEILNDTTPSTRIYSSNKNEQSVELSGVICNHTLLYYKELYSDMLQLYN